MEGRSTVGLFLVVLAAAASSLIMLLERRPSPTAATATSSNVLKDKPFTVIQLEGNGQEMAGLAVMLHDVSLAGFANRSGHWHAFPGHEHLLPGSTPLPFGNSYRDLIGGLANLPNLPLGGPPMVQASSAISGYSPATVIDDNDVVAVKRALATLTVMTCEAQRLQPIRDLLLNKGRWESGEARVAVEHLPYIEHWDTICYEIVRAKKNGVWDGPFTELLKEHANIKNMKEAMAVVGFITTSRTLQDLVVAHARKA
ncbi:hypothetical protein HU200_012629 [Digitaria exilis]|uniref:rRNA N-glycosylase n=1 Tax=Digitaria exilis TaxID=1010633 RepID=A0A835KN35_9POAL|nr:hypothetical protein HU200_012629 [Digitaria exilis]CAB3486381.1 unnamed protein product [Digitaria exilis]